MAYEREEASAQTFSLTSYLLRTGLVKDRKQAESILLGIFTLCILVAIYVLLPDDGPRQDDVQQNPNYEPPKTNR